MHCVQTQTNDALNTLLYPLRAQYKDAFKKEKKKHTKRASIFITDIIVFVDLNW